MYLIFPKSTSFLINENKKKPKLTKANLNASAAKGVESCTITFPEIKADDQSKMKINGKACAIKVKNYL